MSGRADGAPPDPWLDAAVELLAREGSDGTVQVRGGSMAPTLVPGQLLAVRFGGGEPRRGELVLFRQADYLVVHRLLGPARVRGGPPGWRTRGDAQIGLDPPLEPRRVLGSIVGARREDGGWWDLRGPGARLYARSVAAHDLFWAALGAGAAVLDRRLATLVGLRVRPVVARIDRALLGLGHALLFGTLHRRLPERPRGSAER